MEETIIHEGHLMKKGWMSWSRRWFKLFNSKILNFYKDEWSVKPSGTINLVNALEFDSTIPEIRVKRENCFMIKVMEVENIPVSYFLSADTEDQKKEWLKFLTPSLEESIAKNANWKEEALENIRRTKSKAKLKTPKKFSNKKKSLSQSNSPISLKFNPRGDQASKQIDFDEEEETEVHTSKGWWGFTKNMISKVVVSKLGKKLLKDWVSPDGIAFLLLMRDIIIKITNSQQEGDLFEQIVLKTFTDIVILITNKTIPKEKVLLTRDPIFQLWSDVLDMLEISFVFDQERLVDILDQTWHTINEVIFPHVEIEKKDLLDKYSNMLRNEELIVEFYTNDKWVNERIALRGILRRVWESTFTRTSGGNQ